MCKLKLAFVGARAAPCGVLVRGGLFWDEHLNRGIQCMCCGVHANGKAQAHGALPTLCTMCELPPPQMGCLV